MTIILIKKNIGVAHHGFYQIEFGLEVLLFLLICFQYDSFANPSSHGVCSLMLMMAAQKDQDVKDLQQHVFCIRIERR